jgi:glycosyltransferase involved in cell wall biosynthesis
VSTTINRATLGPTSASPLLVHLVGNGVRGDSRVLKSARTSQEAGIPTLIMGVSAHHHRESFELEGVRVLLVAAPQLPQAPAPSAAAPGGRATTFSGWLGDGVDLAVARRPNVRRRLAKAGIRRGVQAVPAPFLAPLGADGVDTAPWAKPVPTLRLTADAFAAALSEIGPTAVHVHDTFPLPAAIAYQRASAAAGRRVRVLYDAHEWVDGLTRKPGGPRAFAAMGHIERNFIREVDAVITVSDEIAGLLMEQYQLPTRPAVVLNAPYAHSEPGPALREVLGIDPAVPLLVYSGWIDAERGVDGAIAALAMLPDVHLALVVGRHSPALAAVLQSAVELGVADRVHLAGYVSPAKVTAYLASADAGLIPRAAGDHLDRSLPTKFREYLHAGLPLVVSTNKQMADEVRRTGVGAVFVSGDIAGLTRAIEDVLAHGAEMRAAISGELLALHSWEAQTDVLLAEYRGLGLQATDPAQSRVGTVSAAWVASDDDDDDVEDENETSSAEGPVTATLTEPGIGFVSLAVGPVNSAGQCHAWAHAAAQNLGVVGRSFGGRTGFDYHVDRLHPRSLDSMRTDAEWLLTAHSHVLVDAFRPVLSSVKGADIGDELELIYRRGVHLGLVAHGSEIRSPARHIERRPESYFNEAPAEWLDTINAVVRRNQEILAMFEGPVFVSTPDLLFDVPHATWLPLVVDTQRWVTDALALEPGHVPVVLHAPSRSTPPVKGSDIIVPVLEELQAAGRIRFLAPENVPHGEMDSLVRSSDILVDQISTGSYGVAAVEAMAAGRLVVGNVADDVRALLPGDVPIVDAAGLEFRRVFEELLDDLPAAARRAAEGPTYASEWHDGRAAARALEPWLRLGTPPLRSTRRG